MNQKIKRLILSSLLLLCLSISNAENYPYRSDVLWVTVPDHADWLYQTGENAQVEVQFLKYGIPRDAEVSYEIAPDMRSATKKGKVKLKHGKAIISLGSLKQPGFLDCKLAAKIDNKVYTHHVKVGFSPEKLQPYTQMPRDFKAYWDKAKEELAQVPLTYTMKKVEAYSDSETECYLVKLKIDKQGRSIYGYLTKPVKPGKYPAVMCPPGAGIKTIKEPLRHIYYAKNNMIRFEIEIHGLNPEMSAEQFNEISKAFNARENGYLSNGWDHRDTYYMRHVYLGCVRAMDFLASLPDWDQKNLAVQGGSQGGALSIITAALDPRINLCVANHPALSDMAGNANPTGQCGGYPHFKKEQLTAEHIQTLAYYDVVNFAPYVKADTYLTWGYNDNTCPPTTSYIVWNQLKTTKESLITPINEHWTSEATEYGHMEWIKKHLK